MRLVKRTESPWAAGEFGGFVAATGRRDPRQARRAHPADRVHRRLATPPATATSSTTRDCSANGGVNRNTNADLSFGALTARAPERRLPDQRLLRPRHGPQLQRRQPRHRLPHLLRPGLAERRRRRLAEPRHVAAAARRGRPGHQRLLDRPQPRRAVDHRRAWSPPTRPPTTGFLDKLRARYGPDTVIVVSATHLAAPPRSPRPPSRSSRTATARATAGSATGTTTTRASTASAATGIPPAATTGSSPACSTTTSPPFRCAGDRTKTARADSPADQPGWFRTSPRISRTHFLKMARYMLFKGGVRLSNRATVTLR